MAATNLKPMTDEELEREALEIQSGIHSGLTVGAASQVIPPVAGGADWRSPSSYLPGLGTYLYGMGSGIAELAGNAIRRNPVQVDPESGQPLVDEATGQQMRKEAAAQPDFVVPGHAAANELNKQSVEAAKKLLPVDAPTTEMGQKAQDLGIAAAQGATGVVPGLPGPVGAALKLAGPPTKTAPIGALLGGTAELLGQEAKKDEPDPYAGIVNPEVQPQPTKAEAATPKPVVDPYTGVVNPEQSTTPSLTPDNDWGWGLGKTLALGTLGIAAAWGAAKVGPRGINVVADLIRGATRDAGVAERALTIPRPGGAPAVEMPLPNDASGWTRQWAMRNVNPNAVLNEYVRAPEVSPTVAQADARVATNELINNPANAQRRMEGLFRTGIEEGTGHTFPKVVDYKSTIDALTDTQRQLFDGAAWYKSELNLRDANIKANVGKGIMWNDDNDRMVRVSMPNISTPAMRDAVLFAEQDPAVKAALDANKAMHTSTVESALRRARITPEQAEHALTAYPDFMPTLDTQGNRLHSWDDKIREPGTGYGNTPPAPAWQATIDHFGGTIQELQLHDWQRSYLLEAERLQASNPNFPKIVNTSEPKAFVPKGSNSGEPIIQEQPVGPSSTKRSMTIYVDGVPKSYDINNTAFWHSLGGGPQQTYIGNGIANVGRKIVQDVNTGPASALFGAPFAAKTVIRDLGLLPAQAPTNMYRGALEAGIGKRIPGLPYDPTFPVSVGRTMAGDVGSVIAEHFTDMLGSPSNAGSAALRKTFGNEKVDALVDWMRKWLDQTNLMKRTAMGVGGGGNKSILAMQTPLPGRSGTYRDPTGYDVAPRLGPLNFDAIPTKLGLPNPIRNTVNGAVRGAAETYINLNSLVRKLYSVISDAPHSAIHDLNVDNPAYTPRTLAATVQNIAGNPGTRGTGRFAQWAASTLPWYNTSMQAGAASLRSFRNSPIAMGSTVATILTLGSLASQLSALMSGKEHVNFLENMLSNSTLARAFTIFHGPGTDPTNHTELPIPNEWGWLKPLHEAAIGHLIGTWNAHDDEATLTRLIHTIADVYDQHLSVDAVKQTGIGVVNAFLPADIAPIPRAIVAATTGQTVQNPIDQGVSNLISGKPISSGMTRGGGPQHNVPGQEGTDGPLNRADSGTLKAVLSAIGGPVAAAWDMYNNFQTRAKIDPDNSAHSWAWDGAWRDYKQEWKDSTRWANSVWQNNLPITSFGSLEERTSNMWQPVARAAGVRSDIRGEGFSKVTRGVPLVVTGESPVPPTTDPQMRNMYMTMAEGGKAIDRNIMPRERDIRAQMDNLKSTPFMPDEKRRIGNQLSQQLYNVTAEKHAALLDLNARLSQLAGGRHVDVGRINWDKGIDQFHY